MCYVLCFTIPETILTTSFSDVIVILGFRSQLSLMVRSVYRTELNRNIVQIYCDYLSHAKLGTCHVGTQYIFHQESEVGGLLLSLCRHIIIKMGCRSQSY